MKEISLKYSGEHFGHSIDVIELWNSLIWFWWYLQLIAKEQNIEDLQINVKATEQGSFVVLLDLIAQNAWLFWETIDILWSLLEIAKTIIELKKHLKWNPPTKTKIEWNGNIKIQNCEWNSISISANTYNFYNTNNVAINRTLWWFTSPLNKIDNLTDIKINGNNWDTELEVSINNQEWLFFSNDSLDKSSENDVLIEGTVKSMSMNNYSWTIEIYKKNYKISFKSIRTINDAVCQLGDSMTHSMKIFVKWNITYQWDDIMLIDITEVLKQDILKE